MEQPKAMDEGMKTMTQEANQGAQSRASKRMKFPVKAKAKARARAQAQVPSGRTEKARIR